MIGVERHVLRVRTRRRPEVAVRYLERLAAALEPEGWRFLRFYRPEPVPLLLVYVRDVGLAVHVLAVRGGAWAYHEGRAGVLASCADVGTAAEVVGLRLKRRMFPGTW